MDRKGGTAHADGEREGGRGQGTAAHFSKENSGAWRSLESAGSLLAQWREAQEGQGGELGLLSEQASPHKGTLWLPEELGPWRIAQVFDIEAELSWGQGFSTDWAFPEGLPGPLTGPTGLLCFPILRACAMLGLGLGCPSFSPVNMLPSFQGPVRHHSSGETFLDSSVG